MAKFNTLVLLLGQPVMGDKVEAANANEARNLIEARFWKGADDLRAELPTMNALNRESAERLIPIIDKLVADARSFGITVEARKSRAA